MTNQRTGNASIIFHNHPLCLPTVLYVGSVRSMNTDLLGGGGGEEGVQSQKKIMPN